MIQAVFTNGEVVTFSFGCRGGDPHDKGANGCGGSYVMKFVAADHQADGQTVKLYRMFCRNCGSRRSVRISLVNDD